MGCETVGSGGREGGITIELLNGTTRMNGNGMSVPHSIADHAMIPASPLLVNGKRRASLLKTQGKRVGYAAGVSKHVAQSEVVLSFHHKRLHPRSLVGCGRNAVSIPHQHPSTLSVNKVAVNVHPRQVHSQKFGIGTGAIQRAVFQVHGSQFWDGFGAKLGDRFP
mmetsp:Transcript_41346/g.46707  ORF Transcript_41346/g.46707 Transcript_41346/m.46707 type:complete len:165 (+) Transcript_41346:460-954(+)